MNEAKTSQLTEMVSAKLRELLTKEMHCRQTIDKAKTRVKQKYHKKKLKSITKQARGALELLQKLEGKKGAKDAVLSK